MARKTKRLQQELKGLQRGTTALPLAPAASIFLRVQEDRPDKMRALITGPPPPPKKKM